MKINYFFALYTQTYGSVLRSDDSKPMNNKIYQEQQRKLQPHYKMEVLNVPFTVF